MTAEGPKCTVLIANYNGSEHLGPAIRSAQSQSLKEIEILVVDDASTDDSLVLVRRLAAEDDRIKIIALERNGGPAKARNAGLDQASGAWIAILDSDDLMHPCRLSVLVGMAERSGADIVADGFIAFDSHFAEPCWLAFEPDARRDWTVDAVSYLGSNSFDGDDVALGYLKPVFRAQSLGSRRYDESLPIGEDFDLVLRMLLEGASFRVDPVPLYLYRRHRGSISHRLSVPKLAPLVARNAAIQENLRREGRLAGPLAAALAERTRSLDQAMAFERIVDAIRRRAWGEFLELAISEPRAALELRRPLAGLFRKPARSSTPAAATETTYVLVPENLAAEPAGSSAPASDSVRRIACPDPAKLPSDIPDRLIEGDRELLATCSRAAKTCVDASRQGNSLIVSPSPRLAFFYPFISPGHEKSIYVGNLEKTEVAGT